MFLTRVLRGAVIGVIVLPLLFMLGSVKTGAVEDISGTTLRTAAALGFFVGILLTLLRPWMRISVRNLWLGWLSIALIMGGGIYLLQRVTVGQATTIDIVMVMLATMVVGGVDHWLRTPSSNS